MGLSPFHKKIAKAIIHVRRRDDLQLDPLVALSLALCPCDPARPQTQDLARARTRRNGESHGAVDGRCRDLAAENGLVDGDRESQENVVALAMKNQMGPDDNGDERITCCTATNAGRALAAQPQRLSVFGAPRDLDRKALAIGQGDASLGASCSIQKRHLERIAGIWAMGRKPTIRKLSTGRPSTIAEDFGEDVNWIGIRAEPSPVLVSVVRGTCNITIVLPLRAFCAKAVDLSRIILCVGLGILQDLIGSRDRLELRFGLGIVGMQVRMAYPHQFPIRLFYLVSRDGLC